MPHVKVGDRVLGADGKYHLVYTFARKEPGTVAQFLRVHTNGSTTPIELTPNHFIFLYEQHDPVMAESLAKGDVLVGAAEMKPLEITKIEKIIARGIFAPRTTDGTIAVNGVVSSCYSSTVPDCDTYLWGTNYKIMTCPWFAHMRYSPLRLASIGISSWFAKTNEKGMNFLSCAYKQAADWMRADTPNALSYGIVAFGTFLFYTLCGIALFSYGIECLVGPTLGPTTIVLIVGASVVALRKQRQTKVGVMKLKVH